MRRHRSSPPPPPPSISPASPPPPPSSSTSSSSSTISTTTTTRLSKPSPHRKSQSSSILISPAATPAASRNSSLQTLWAEDYYADDNPSTTTSFTFPPASPAPSPPPPPQEISPPPRAALTSRPFPRSIPLTADEESHPARQPRTHQRSLTDLLPSLYASHPTCPRHHNHSRSRSPIKELSSSREFEDEFMPTLTGDRERIIKVADRSRGGLAGWFSGASAPVQLGMPVMEQNMPESLASSGAGSGSVPVPAGAGSAAARNASPERPTAKLQKRPTLSSIDSSPAGPTSPTKSAASTATSMFGGFFSSPKTPSRQTVQIPVELNQDELLTLDIEKALFPAGPADPFSPSAFKNLQSNAEGLLLRLQTAYKLRTMALHELQDEENAKDEEFEEAEIRATSLRSQLEDMAQRLSTQEEAMKQLAAELGAEKQARAEEQEAREKSIALIKFHRTSYASSLTSPSEDDYHIAGFRRKHKSYRTSYGSTDISEDESDAVFSDRSRSPALTVDSTFTASSTTYAQSNASTTEIGQATVARMVKNPRERHFKSNSADYTAQAHTNLSANVNPNVHVKPNGNGSANTRPKVMHQSTSTFQKVLKSISTTASPETSPTAGEAEAEAQAESDMFGMGESSCSNCQGKDARFAWDTVGLLKVENKGLKERVGELEGGVDLALDAVLGLGLTKA